MIGLVIVLLIVGAALYIVQRLPIDATVKQIIYAILIVGVVIWLLQVLMGQGGHLRVPTP